MLTTYSAESKKKARVTGGNESISHINLICDINEPKKVYYKSVLYPCKSKYFAILGKITRVADSKGLPLCGFYLYKLHIILLLVLNRQQIFHCNWQIEILNYQLILTWLSKAQKHVDTPILI